MAEEIAFENARISNFQGLVALTLVRVILHTVVHHLSTSTYMPNFIKIEENFCGKIEVRTYTYVRTYIRMDGQTLKTHFIKSTQKSQPKKSGNYPQQKQ